MRPPRQMYFDLFGVAKVLFLFFKKILIRKKYMTRAGQRLQTQTNTAKKVRKNILELITK